MLGTYVLSAGYYDAYYLKAQQVRTLIRRDYEQAFEQVDVVAMPTSPTPAFRIGERVADPLQMYLADIFTVSANLAGLPAISIPCGFTADPLPIGLQLTGRHVRRNDAALGRARIRTADRMVEGPAEPVTPPWASLSDEQLLDVRMCDLDLRIEGTELQHRIAMVDAELQARGLVCPHYWISEEWFSPDGVPGVAVPFYLLAPAAREARALADARSGRRRRADLPEDPAPRGRTRHRQRLQLRRRPARRELFGRPSTPYPEYYTPKPYSKSFVQHLDHWYAQSHPDEDFAETFATWLDPNDRLADAIRRMAGRAQAAVHGPTDAQPGAREAEGSDHVARSSR